MVFLWLLPAVVLAQVTQTTNFFLDPQGAAFLTFAGHSCAVFNDTAALGSFSAGLASTVFVFETSDQGATWAQTQSLASGEQNFGYSLILEQDWLFVSEPYVGNTDGQVNVFRRADWTVVQVLSASGTSSDFGISMAKDGDLLAVGASQEAIGGLAGRGAVYIFVSSDGGETWADAGKLTASDDPTLPKFLGLSVGVSGSTVVIGAQDNIGDNINQGSVYVFDWDGSSSWTETKLTAANGAASDLLGRIVAINGDIVVAVAPNADVGDVEDHGSATVFVRNGSTWTETVTLTEVGNAIVMCGGTLVASSRDFADGVDIYSSADGGNTWVHDVKITSSDADVAFGYSVAVHDGIVVGGAVFANPATFVGGGYVALVDSLGPCGNTSSAPAVDEAQTYSPTASQSQSFSENIPGLVGDPVLVDFAGHRFLGGSHPTTEYVLYRSADGHESITMTTGSIQGEEDGYFSVATKVSRTGCGHVRIEAAQGHTANIDGDPCMRARIARGDEGLVLVPIGEGGESGSVLAVFPHGSHQQGGQGDAPVFLNLRLLATTPEFRSACSGMLCEEVHGDVEA